MNLLGKIESRQTVASVIGLAHRQAPFEPFNRAQDKAQDGAQNKACGACP